MWLDVGLLFLTPLAGAFMYFFLEKRLKPYFPYFLIFAGAYLFSITVVHLLPELFVGQMEVHLIGAFVLAGFFIQILLGSFTNGLEHGHIHSDNSIPTTSLFLGLCIHAFMEGTLLSYRPTVIDHDHHSTGLLIGVILHKIPATIAFLSVLSVKKHQKTRILILLLVFALMTPLGMVLSDIFYIENMVPAHIFTVIFALVAGNFLHISTTIFFESSRDHSIQVPKAIISLLGALVAVIFEFFIF